MTSLAGRERRAKTHRKGVGIGKVVTPRHYILTADWVFRPQQPNRKLRDQEHAGEPGQIWHVVQLWPMVTSDSCSETTRLHEAEPRPVGCPAL